MSLSISLIHINWKEDLKVPARKAIIVKIYVYMYVCMYVCLFVCLCVHGGIRARHL